MFKLTETGTEVNIIS